MMKIVECEKCPLRNWCWRFFEKAKEYLEGKNIEENLELEDFCPLMTAFMNGVSDYIGSGIAFYLQSETLREMEGGGRDEA